MEPVSMAKENGVMVELKHLTKVYGSGHLAVNAVNDVSLHITKGETVAIMGPSGSGKTTLLQMVGALLRPTSGEIIINGKSISALAEKDLPHVRLRTFGFIFQTPNLLSALTALQNVELVMNLSGHNGNDSRNRAVGLLEQLGLGDRLKHKPAKLSGGEQQRVAVARALANDPQVLLADEPTANLDSKNGQAVMELLRGIAKNQGKTVVIVSHDDRIRYIVDRVLWLEDGRLKVRWSDNVTIDPVCLMVVEKDRAIHVSEYDGQHYYFCTAECLREFEKAPHKYREASHPS